MRLARSVALGLLLLTATGDLVAQTVPSSYRYIETNHAVGAFGGYLNAHSGRLDLGPKPGALVGARYDIHLTGPLSGEVAVGFSSTDRTIYVLPVGGSPAALEPVGEDEMLLMLGEAGFHFRFTGARTWRRIAPYAALSLGFITDLTRRSPLEAEIPAEQKFEFGPAFAASLGLGNEFFLSERLSVRAEARDYLWRYTYPGGLVESGVRESEWQHNIGLTLGASFHL